MAKYTIELRALMDDPAARARLDAAMSTYPLYAPPAETAAEIPTREELNERLLNHYKYREIGFETPGRFLEELKNTMHVIMPRYNELFKTVVTMADIPNPFDSVDMVETFEQTNTNQATTTDRGSTTTNTTAEDETTDTAETNTAQTATGKNVEADTPQGSIITAAGVDAVTNGSMAKWNKDTTEGNTDTTATRATTSTSSGSGTSENENTVTANASTKYTHTRKGAQGVTTYAHDMIEFRESIIDVVDQIINDKRVRELFMTVY